MENNEKIEIEIVAVRETTSIVTRTRGILKVSSLTSWTATPSRFVQFDGIVMICAMSSDGPSQHTYSFELHREMIVLEKFCALNYTAVRKILQSQRHDKKRNNA